MLEYSKGVHRDELLLSRAMYESPLGRVYDKGTFLSKGYF